MTDMSPDESLHSPPSVPASRRSPQSPEAPRPSAPRGLRDAHLRRLADETPPHLVDATGYVLDERPLAMSGVRVNDMRAALAGIRPLGFPSVALWQEFQTDMVRAFGECGLTDVSARLGGSSRSFFSSPWARRPFPQDLGDLRAQIVAAKHNRGLGMDDIESLFAEASGRYIEAGFNRPGKKPGKHFWDSRYLLHIDSDPADFDIEVASEELDARMRREAAQWRADHLGEAEDFRVDSGSQWNPLRVIEVMAPLARFRERWSERLGRPVDFECFDGNERLRFAKRPDWWVIPGLE